MNSFPIEQGEQLRVGTVDFVSPNEIRAILEIDSPDTVALNAGTPRNFPRVNSYVLISCDNGYLVGQIEWLAVEHSPYPKQRDIQDFGLVNLPFPRKKISLNPVLDAFQMAVNKYHIPSEYIDAFMKSMKMDLTKKHYLSIEEMPNHKHSTSPFNKFVAKASDLSNNNSSSTGFDNNSSSNELAIGNLNATQMITATEKSIGGNQPHNNVQPSIVANYIEWVGLAQS